MKIEIQKEVILAAVSAAAYAVGRSKTIRITSTILLEAGDGMRVIATDLDKEVASEIHADEMTVHVAGAICIDGLSLLAFVKRVRSGAMISIETASETGTARVSNGHAVLELPTRAAEDFPRITVPEWDYSGDVTAETLSWVFGQVAHAISTEEVRFQLNGVYMHVDGGRMIFVATDGHRLAKAEISTPDGLECMEGAIFPRAALSLVSRLLGGVSGDDMVSLSFDAGKSKVRIEVAGAVVVSKLIDTRFPDYNRVIPKDTSETATFNKNDLLRSLQTVTIAGTGKGHAVKFEVNGSVRLSTHDSDGRQCHDEIDSATRRGGELTVGYNAKYVQDALAASEGDEITLCTSDAGSPAIWKGSEGDSVFVLMPMRVL